MGWRQLLLGVIAIFAAGPVWSITQAIVQKYEEEKARRVPSARASAGSGLDLAPAGKNAVDAPRRAWSGTGGGTSNAWAALWHPSATTGTHGSSAPAVSAAPVNSYTRSTSPVPVAAFRAAGPMTFTPLAPAGIAPRRSAAAGGVKPQAAGQTLYVDSTDPKQSNEAYVGSSYTVPAGTTTFDNVNVGYNGMGMVTQAGNSLTVSSTLYLGVNTGSNGKYNLQGGSLSTGAATIGNSGTGTFTQTGTSTFTTNSGDLFLGLNAGSNGTYNLSGTGSLSTGTVVVGYSGTGTFIQSGGVFTTNGNTLFVGGNPGSGGSSYTLSGTGSLSTGGAVVGYQASSLFTQSGGTFTTNGGKLFVGELAGGNGTYNLSAGTLTTGITVVSDNANTSSFTQSGGLHTTGTLILTGNTTSSNGTYSLQGGTLNVGTVEAGDGGVPGTSTFNFNGGTLQASASNTDFVSGLTAANVQAGGAKIDTNGNSVTIAQSLTSGTLSGTTDGGLTKLGTGTLTLTGANTYTGTTTVNAGLLVLADGANGATVVNNGAALQVQTGTTVTGGTGRTAVTFSGGGALTNTGTITGSGSGVVFSGAGGTLINGNGGTINGGVTMGNSDNRVALQIGSTINGGLNMGTNTASTLLLSDDGTGGTQNYSKAVTGGTTFAGALDKEGTGTWVIDQALTYTDGTFLGQGVLQVANAGALDTTGTLTFAGGTLQYSAANTTDYSGRISTEANQAVNIDTNGQNVTFASALTSNAGTLTKSGAGTLTLTANNTYSGTTDVRGGALMVTNVPVGDARSATGSGSVFVEQGAWLGGTGVIGGDVTVGSGPTIFPGPAAVRPQFTTAAGTLTPGVAVAGASAPGVLTINGNLTLLSGTANLEIDLAGANPGTGYDQVRVGGYLTLGGTLTLTLGTGFAPTPGEKFFLLVDTGSAAVSGMFDDVPQGSMVVDSAGNEYVISYTDSAGDGTDGNDVSLTLVPEPGTWAMLGLGGVVLALGALRRCSRSVRL